MEPADAQTPTPGPDAAQAAENGAAAAAGPAVDPLLTPPESGPPAQSESPEVAAARMAAKALDDVGGLIARVDQMETQLRRVDRQTLMLVGMVALCMWSIKSLAGKVDVADAAAATTG